MESIFLKALQAMTDRADTLLEAGVDPVALQRAILRAKNRIAAGDNDFIVAEEEIAPVLDDGTAGALLVAAAAALVATMEERDWEKVAKAAEVLFNNVVIARAKLCGPGEVTN